MDCSIEGTVKDKVEVVTSVLQDEVVTKVEEVAVLVEIPQVETAMTNFSQEAPSTNETTDTRQTLAYDSLGFAFSGYSFLALVTIIILG